MARRFDAATSSCVESALRYKMLRQSAMLISEGLTISTNTSLLQSMATTEAAAPEPHAHGDHGHDHDHPSFLAHHFDTPEQQFDSGKLGMWLFLTTEVLFFSGRFCAYAIYRMLRPEVFEGCSQFLNTQLGAINTGVLLFSSLTMAWAVRCAQTEEHRKLTALLATTLSCAMIFLGVKAIEYSHKWTLGLLPPGMFFYDPSNPHPEGGPNYLLWICAPFALATVGVLVWLAVSYIRGNKFHVAIAKPLTVVCLCFFVGVGLGTLLESGGSTGESVDHASSEGHPGDQQHASEEEVPGEQVEHADEIPAPPVGVADAEPSGIETVEPQQEIAIAPHERAAIQQLSQNAVNTGLRDEIQARRRQADAADGMVVSEGGESLSPVEEVPENVLTPRRAGVFFGIYYCMTGVHAIHILGGIGVLVWLLVRSIRQDFNRQYFGPVDYVGLYWHLVDLIWIYLFPLLYLIR